MMNFVLYSTTFIVFSTIAAGVYFLKKGYDKNQKVKRFLKLNLSVFIPILFMAVILLVPNVASAAGEGDSSTGWGYLGAALSTGLACLGCGVAVGNVGSAALGAVSEDEKMLGKTLIYVGLAEGIAIYGLVISIMILGTL